MVRPFQEFQCLIFVDGVEEECHVHGSEGFGFVVGESVLGDDGLGEEVEGAGVLELEGEGAEEVLE
jgi:hypothetical protein